MRPSSYRVRSIVSLVALLFAVVGCGRRAEPESFLVPSGYVGEVYVVFGVPDGAAPEIRDGRRIYRIPPSGILRTQLPATYGWSNQLYFYVSAGGEEPVRLAVGPGSTIHDTAENRAKREVEILRAEVGTTTAPVPGEPGSGSSEAPCAVRFSNFFVGNRAQFLDRASRLDIGEYLEHNPVRCDERV